MGAIDSTLPAMTAALLSLSTIQVLVVLWVALTGHLQQFLGPIFAGVGLCGSAAVDVVLH